jgi:hypothetical protein
VIEDGTKVETDTSRTVDTTAFDGVWSQQDETPEIEAARTGGEPAPDTAPETGAAPASSPEPEAITREDGATWSEKAQRWYKDGKIVAGEKPETPVAPSTPSVTPEAPKVEGVVAPEAPKVEPPAPVVEPFTFRANGQKHTIPGLVVPPEQQELVRALLVDGMNHRQNLPKLQTEWKQKLAQAESLVAARTEKYNRAAVHLFDKLKALLAENPAELEMTKRELALMLKEADLTVPRAPEPAAQAEPGGVDESAARATLAGYVKELFEDTKDAAKLFTPEDRKDFEAHVQDLIESFFVEHEGEIVLAEHKVEALFKRELTKLQRAHQAREDATRAAQKLTEAARFNAATNAPVKPPVAARPKPALAAAPSGAAKTPDQLFREAWENADED